MGWAIFSHGLSKINEVWNNEKIKKSKLTGIFLIVFYFVEDIGVYLGVLNKESLFTLFIVTVGSIVSLWALGLYFIGVNEEIPKENHEDEMELNTRIKKFIVLSFLSIIFILVAASLSIEYTLIPLLIIVGFFIQISELFYTLSIPYFIKNREYFHHEEVF